MTVCGSVCSDNAIAGGAGLVLAFMGLFLVTLYAAVSSCGYIFVFQS